jgi:SAM-dependent methyltransferase
MKRFLLAIYRRLPWRALNRWVAYSERRRLLDRALAGQADFLRGRVLEVGAGREGRRGRFVPPVEDAGCWVSLDLTREHRPHLAGNVLALPFSDAAFDSVLCLEVLEYVPDYPRALAELRRAIAPGGTLLLSVPFLHRADTPQDTWRLTENGLRAALEAAGFTIELVEPQGAALLVATNVLKYAVHLARPTLLRTLLATLAWLPLMTLRWLDGPTAHWQPILRSYSTGFLVRARRVGGGGRADM